MPNKVQKLIKALTDSSSPDIRMYLPDSIMNKWHPEIQAKDSDISDNATINIYDIIGEDYWYGQGMTAKIVSNVLRRNKGGDILVNINSPGGDYFEGLAIYNLLKEHDGKVTIRVVGMAASAASVVACAGTEVKIAEAGFIMIHNAWHVAIGNKNVMRDHADTLEKFDETMIRIYEKKTGLSTDELRDMCDAETWITGKDAVEMGFATQYIDSDEAVKTENSQTRARSALKEVDVAMAKAGHSRAQRRNIIKNLTGTPCATVDETVTPCANENHNWDAYASFVNNLKKGISYARSN